MRRTIVLGTALVLILALAAACGLIELRSSEESTAGSDTSQVVSQDEASEALQELEVAPPVSMAGYSRERFPHWSRADEFGWDPPQASCDVRQAALIRDGEDVRVGDAVGSANSLRMSSRLWGSL